MEHFYMIYAEGHNAPAKKFENKEDAEREARRIADKEHCEVFVLSDDYMIRPTNIMDRVKTFEDAYKILYGHDTRVFEKEVLYHLFSDETAYRKLKIIATALNEGWNPDWSNKTERKWFIMLFVEKKAQFGCADMIVSATPAANYTGIESNLYFKSKELAEYAASQFLDLYKQFYLGDKF